MVTNTKEKAKVNHALKNDWCPVILQFFRCGLLTFIYIYKNWQRSSEEVL